MTKDLFLLRDLPRALRGVIVFSDLAVQLETAQISAVSIDSRTCGKGSLFFALPGEKTDGHNYVRDAIATGATAAVVGSVSNPDGKDWDLPVVQVTDTLTALQDLAAWYARTALSSVIRIGITGSNGKTTTKELVAAILRCSAPTSASFGNLNSETGVPLSVFAADPESRYAVFEMAISRPGEMEPLAEIVRPHYAIITNVGSAHIGQMGSREAIAAEKKAIASRFEGSQTLFIPENDDYTAYLGDSIRGTVKLFGPEVQNVELHVTGDPRCVTIRGEETYTLSLGGYHNGMNALAAIALARDLELSPECIGQGLSSVSLPAGRSRIVSGGMNRVILDDSYNANPDSMSAALKAVRALHESRLRTEPSTGELVLIMGAMRELGEAAAPEHHRILESARGITPDLICLVGADEWGPADERGSADERERAGERRHADEQGPAGSSSERRFSDVKALAAELPKLLKPGQTILLKGSRSVALETLLPVLQGDCDA